VCRGAASGRRAACRGRHSRAGGSLG
jgi:hypothetical protein